MFLKHPMTNSCIYSVISLSQLMTECIYLSCATRLELHLHCRCNDISENQFKIAVALNWAAHLEQSA